MNWKKVKLESVCAIIAGQSPPSSTYNTDAIGLPFFQGKADFGITSPKVRIWCSSPQKIAEPNDILLSVRAPVGPTNICNQKSCIGRGLSAIRANNNIYFKYILYFFKQLEPKLTLSGVGSTFGSITQTDIKNLEIPLPDLATQKHIAEVLDKADALRQQNRQLLANYDELLQSTFIELFGDPVKNPKEWEVKKLGEVVENKNNLRIPVKDADRKEMQGEYPYYGATGVIDSVNDYKFDGEYLLIAEDGKNLLFRKKPNAFMAYGKFWVNNHAHIMKYNGKANLRFLEFCFNKIDLKPYVTGIDQFKLTRNTLDIIPIPIPPLPLQQHFAKIVEQIEAQKAQAQAALTESEALFEGLLAGYFNA